MAVPVADQPLCNFLNSVKRWWGKWWNRLGRGSGGINEKSITSEPSIPFQLKVWPTRNACKVLPFVSRQWKWLGRWVWWLWLLRGKGTFFSQWLVGAGWPLCLRSGRFQGSCLPWAHRNHHLSWWSQATRFLGQFSPLNLSPYRNLHERNVTPLNWSQDVEKKKKEKKVRKGVGNIYRWKHAMSRVCFRLLWREGRRVERKQDWPLVDTWSWVLTGAGSIIFFYFSYVWHFPS